MSLLAFADKELLCYTEINVFPRKNLFIVTASCGIEERVDSVFRKAFFPRILFEMFRPTVKFAAFFPRGFDNIAEASVTSCENTLKEAGPGHVAGNVNFSCCYAGSKEILLFDKGIGFILRFPLERSERFGNERSKTYATLTLLPLGLSGFL